MQQNKQMKPKDALRLGVVDALFEPADFLEQSIGWAAGVVRGDVSVERAAIDRDSWDAIVDIAQGMLDDRIHGAAPAPYRALDLVRAARSSTRDEGFAAEDVALSELVMGDELRAGLYAFDLVQKRAKRPAGAPDKSLARKVTKVGVVGAGLMASQLALLFATAPGSGGHHRPRSAAGRQGPRSTSEARSTAAWRRAALTRTRRTGCARSSPAPPTRPTSPTATSSSKRSSRSSA